MPFNSSDLSSNFFAKHKVSLTIRSNIKKDGWLVRWGDAVHREGEIWRVGTDIELLAFGGRDLLRVGNVAWLIAPAGHRACCCRGCCGSGRDKRARKRGGCVEGVRNRLGAVRRVEWKASL